MATIPIEVIVQDKEVPVVPSEDGTNNTETNITVPDTGTISSNGDTSSSASSIILPAILLVLAIGSIVAILIHKYHKQKKDKTTRKEKLAVATSSTIAVLAVTVLIGNLVLPATKAATNTTINSITPTEDKITITIDRGEALESSAASTTYATVATTFGYEILLAASNSTANLYLNGDVTSEYYITPTESAELGANTWGYSLEEGVDYEAVPLADNAALITKGTEVVENEEFDVYYGAKVSEDLPAGTYKGEIEYILSGTGFPYALRTMQDMTTEICESAPTPNAFKADGTTIEDIVPTATLKDIRDNKTYTIAKLADGKCWMTQNLDLEKEDLLAGVVLNDSNTDHPAEGFALPISQTNGSDFWGDGSETGFNTGHVYDLASSGQDYYYCIEAYPSGSCKTYSDEKVPSEFLGNYYNWYAATAGTGTYNMSDGEVATGSICPTGWRLPTGSTDGSPTDYSNLAYLYGIYTSATSSGSSIPENIPNLSKTPLSIIPAGNYYYGGVGSVGVSGHLWSSMSKGLDITYAFYFNVLRINPFYSSNGSGSGYSMRCLAR